MSQALDMLLYSSGQVVLRVAFQCMYEEGHCRARHASDRHLVLARHSAASQFERVVVQNRAQDLVAYARSTLHQRGEGISNKVLSTVLNYNPLKILLLMLARRCTREERA